MDTGTDNTETKSLQSQKTNYFFREIWPWVDTYLLKPSILGVIALSVLLSIVLFFNPVIGMGDDGSTAGVISGSDLYNLDELSPKESMSFFQKDWGIMEYYNDSVNIQK